MDISLLIKIFLLSGAIVIGLSVNSIVTASTEIIVIYKIDEDVMETYTEVYLIPTGWNPMMEHHG